MAVSKVKSQKSKVKIITQKAKVEKKEIEEVKPKAISKKEVRLSVSVFDISGKEAGTIKLPEGIFGVKVNPTLLAQAVRVYLANQRSGNASTKTRGDVQGSTRKIYRQKGTGRARHGARYAPIFVGGGVAHGPHPHDFSLSMPKKMRRLALCNALALKLSENHFTVVDGVEKIKGKTKEAVSMLSKLNLSDQRGKANKVLMVFSNGVDLAARAMRNVDGLTFTRAQNLHTYEVLNCKNIVVTKDSIGILEELLLNKKQNLKVTVQAEAGKEKESTSRVKN